MSNFVKGYVVQTGDKFWDFASAKFYASADSDSVTCVREDADKMAAKNGGHVLTIVDGAKYVPHYENHARFMQRATECLGARNALDELTQGDSVESFLRAKINGIAPVPKPKRYLLPLAGTEDGDGDVQYLWRNGTQWLISVGVSRGWAQTSLSVSESDLANRPAWAMGIEPVEVTDDDD